MSASIFISYRRSDAGGHAGRLYDRLAQWFDADKLFFDAENINPGVPAPRFRVPAGAVQPFRVIERSLSPYFSDPNHALAALRRALDASGSAAVMSPVAIHGLGGVGKTQLALKYSLEFRDRYSGVWWFRAETDATLQLDALDALDCCRLVGAAIGEGEPPSLALKRWLGQMGTGAAPWLLMFDNAEDPAALRPNLPERGSHHVLITSRNPAWSGIARPVATAVWTPEQGADFLARRLPAHASSHDQAALRELADALGGLLLALEQAAGFLDETGMAAAEYTAQVRGHDSAPLLLDEGRAAAGYERSVLATLSIAFPRLGEDAAQLLRLLAFCVPDPVPERLFREQPEHLPAALADAARQPFRWEKAVAALRRYGLAERTYLKALDRMPGQANERREPALQLHRLTQEVARHRMVAEPQATAGVLLTLLRRALPADAGLPLHWHRYSSLVPHVLQLDRLSAHAAIDRRQLSWLLDRSASYFQYGPVLYPAARHSFERALAMNRDDLGEEHPDTLRSINNLAITLWRCDERREAIELMTRTVDTCTVKFGADHPTSRKMMDALAQMRAAVDESSEPLTTP